MTLKEPSWANRSGAVSPPWRCELVHPSSVPSHPWPNGMGSPHTPLAKPQELELWGSPNRLGLLAQLYHASDPRSSTSSQERSWGVVLEQPKNPHYGPRSRFRPKATALAFRWARLAPPVGLWASRWARETGASRKAQYSVRLMASRGAAESRFASHPASSPTRPADSKRDSGEVRRTAGDMGPSASRAGSTPATAHLVVRTIHRNEPQVICPVCGKAWRTTRPRGSLLRHIRRYHPDDYDKYRKPNELEGKRESGTAERPRETVSRIAPTEDTRLLTSASAAHLALSISWRQGGIGLSGTKSLGNKARTRMGTVCVRRVGFVAPSNGVAQHCSFAFEVPGHRDLGATHGGA